VSDLDNLAALTAAIDKIDHWLRTNDYDGIDSPQMNLLLDTSCADEAWIMLSDWRMRVGVPEELAGPAMRAVKRRMFGDADTGMTAAEFLRLFPSIETNYHTGGGCTAWNLQLAHGYYVLITDGIDAYQPERDDAGAMFGVSKDCADVDGEECAMMTWAQAVPWLRERITKYSCI
jgi:hypothetical protein